MGQMFVRGGMAVLVGTRSALIGLAFEVRLGTKKSSAVSPARARTCLKSRSGISSGNGIPEFYISLGSSIIYVESLEARVGIEPTNKGFAGHLSNHRNQLNLNGLTLDSILVGPGLGSTLQLVLLWLLMCTAFEACSFH